VWREILEVGEGLNKPGKPYIVDVDVKGYFETGAEFEQWSASIELGDNTYPSGLWKSI